MILFIFLSAKNSYEKCILSEKTANTSLIECHQSTLEKFFTYFSNIPNLNENQYFIDISYSCIPKILYIPLPIIDTSRQLISLNISHSKIEFISETVFRYYQSLQALILTGNKLKDYNFMNYFPIGNNLEKLCLNKNLFQSVTNMNLYQFPKLKYLDFSNCQIIYLASDFFNSASGLTINFSNNNLTQVNLFINNNYNVDFSKNFIEIVNMEVENPRYTHVNLNLQQNNLTNINTNPNSFLRIDVLDLSNNNFQNNSIFTTFNSSPVKNLNLSNCNIQNIDQKNLPNISVWSMLDLSNNNISRIPPYALNPNFCNLISLILFNSSVKEIEENAFSFSYLGTTCGDYSLLNLSLNNLITLSNYTFNNTKVETLDLSTNNINKIENEAFTNFICINLLLNRNKISYLSPTTFKKLIFLKQLDLSFNPLKKLNNNLFTNCLYLKYLNLSNAEIEVIRKSALNGTSQLEDLNLSHNLLNSNKFNLLLSQDSLILNLENNSISDLDEFVIVSSIKKLNTKHNQIQTLKNHTFDNNNELEILDLSHNKIEIIQTEAFQNLNKLEILILKHNNLSKIQDYVFYPLITLKILDLSNNPLKILSPQAFNFNNLIETLNISFYEVVPNYSFVYLNYLKILNLIDSNLLLIKNFSLIGLRNLNEINLINVQIKQIESGTFFDLIRLNEIDLYNFFKEVEILKSQTFIGLRIKFLDFSGMKVNQIEPETFKNLKDLQFLNLNKNNLKALENNSFLGLDSLKTLNLSSNQISRIETDTFIGLERLEKLFLDNNKILNQLQLGTFQNLPNLKELNLEKNNLNKIYTGTFSNLPKLLHLNLSLNNLTRLEADLFVPLTDLLSLDLSANNLFEMRYGLLFDSLRGLEYIGLSGNIWKCDELSLMLISAKNHSVKWTPNKNITYFTENIDGIGCIDVCKYLYCAETHKHYISG